MMEGTLHKPDAIGHGTQLCCLNKVGQGASLLAQMVMNLPAMQEMQETQFQSLGQEDPLQKEMATHFSILAGKISWAEESGGLQSMGSQNELEMTK